MLTTEEQRAVSQRSGSLALGVGWDSRSFLEDERSESPSEGAGVTGRAFLAS